MKQLATLLILLSLTPSLYAETSPLPAEKLGRPVRIHVARGLWWQYLRIYDAGGLLGGVDFTKSHDVYGSPKGYHGCGKALGSFPKTLKQLSNQDIIIIAGARLAALRKNDKEALKQWVKQGGGLLITGGVLSLDVEAKAFAELADILPVSIEKADGIRRLEKDNVLTPTAEGKTFFADVTRWDENPRILWINENVKPKTGATVLLTVGKRPILTIQPAGKGKVAVFSATVCGDVPNGEMAFWDWPGWPQVMADLLCWLSPESDLSEQLVKVTRSKTYQKDLQKLKELSKAGLDDLIDELGADEENDIPQTKPKAGKNNAAELANLAKNCCDNNYATAVVSAIAASGSKISLKQANLIFAHISPFIEESPELRKVAAELCRSNAAGRAALGLRVSGRMKTSKATQQAIINYLKNGLDGLKKERVIEDNSKIRIDAKLQVQDGSDERLRLAAIKAAAELKDSSLIPSIKSAYQYWLRRREKLDTTADLQRDLEEAILATLAVLGDPESAVWVVNRVVSNQEEIEGVIDFTRKPMYVPTKESIKERRYLTQVKIPRLRKRNQYLKTMLTRVPPSSLTELAKHVESWDNILAEEALQVCLCYIKGKSLTGKDRQALETFKTKSPIKSIRLLAGQRLKLSE